MTSFRYDQFVAFGSDSAGLERILRGLQALTSILAAYPSLLALLLSTPDPPLLEALGPLRGHLTLTRRFIRFFWFLNSFGASYNAYAAISSPPPAAAPAAAPCSTCGKAKKRRGGAGLEAWLDVLRLTLLGLYGGLESVTLPDLLRLPKTEIFGPERTAALNVEAQRFWFLALACGIVANLVRVLKAFAYAPVPQHGAGYGTGEEKKPAATANGTSGENGSAGDAAVKDEAGGEKTAADGEEKLDWEVERARLRAIVVKRREDRRSWRRRVAGTVKTLGRKVVSDSLDCLSPGVVLGWVDVGPGVVGVAMFVTTVLTSRDIWERCGAEVAAKRGVS